MYIYIYIYIYVYTCIYTYTVQCSVLSTNCLLCVRELSTFAERLSQYQ